MKINVINVKNWDTWHTFALVLDVLTAIIMAMLQQIAQTKSYHQAHQQDTEIAILTQDNVINHHLGITIRIDTITVIIGTGIGLAGPDPAHTATDTGVTVTMTQEEVIPGTITDPHIAAHHITEAPAHTATDETPPHSRSSSHRNFSRDCSRSRPSTSHKCHHRTSARSSYSSDQTGWKAKDRKHKQVTIDDTPSEYYTSDEQASDSEDVLN